MTSPSNLQIEEALNSYRVAPDSDLCDRIRVYISLLLKWNRSISLTKVTNLDEILRFHFGESLFAVSALSIENGRLADVGSGAGFPGIPLAMLVPGLSVTLIESNTKKFAFLSEVARELGLGNVLAVRSRMDDFKRTGPPFDLVTARALGQFEDLLDWSKKQLCVSGRLVLWLGKADVAKISAESSWKWNAPISIPGSEHRFILSGSPLP
jgi:16S rRNA (guanine527-N7)-methyltransferase